MKGMVALSIGCAACVCATSARSLFETPLAGEAFSALVAMILICWRGLLLMQFAGPARRGSLKLLLTLGTAVYAVELVVLKSDLQLGVIEGLALALGFRILDYAISWAAAFRGRLRSAGTYLFLILVVPVTLIQAQSQGWLLELRGRQPPGLGRLWIDGLYFLIMFAAVGVLCAALAWRSRYCRLPRVRRVD